MGGGGDTMEVNGYRKLFGYPHSSKYLKKERNLYKFGTSEGWMMTKILFLRELSP